mmetsp:Transcript_32446/g.69107  ORF Transcript_32446/g.69107 Transcript_32446/m.69107 type:complete len:169 (-) Transcript_32446:236-742(-)|eukprot:CAMPEP_0180557076 /NCGR_PEP_ID=MMETSP1037_2-20121125/962_1 /TAXON_ID=632150 /ORGANISM="Azadinium spinosum, Strain 3D9" /LENGTH=168 /DNA_ID=CAMNT_0022573241 /DNA_START=43 /DNA_END=549 /DNA_ORIENTATION=-
MASAELKLLSTPPMFGGSTDIEAVKLELNTLISFPRDAPPPQFPQIPAPLWAEIWDAQLAVYAEAVVAGRKLTKIMPFQLCICCCGPCIVMPRMMTFNAENEQRWMALLHKVQPMLSSVGIGVSFYEELAGGGKTQIRKDKAGLRFDSSAAPVVAAQVVVASPSQVMS